MVRSMVSFFKSVLKSIGLAAIAQATLMTSTYFGYPLQKWLSELLQGVVSSGAVSWLLMGLIVICGTIAFEKLERRNAANKIAVNRITAQTSFSLWEASCLLAKSELREKPTGQASSELYQLKRFLAEQEIQMPYLASGKRLNAPEKMVAMQIEKISDNQAIARDALIKYMNKQNKKVQGLS